ncbi:MAG: hypothetical protein KGM42_16440 [Hyphomicrobiales bacterium]|nr:hypothetical protein [Hyphomicrobiales bacterium]
MSERVPTTPVRKRHLSREMLAAAVAVAALAVVLAHPAVMSMAGLDISRQQAFGQIDPMATGSVTAERETHGLAGVIKPLRMKD